MKRNEFLRVKLKSLAEEARIIRLEEQRAKKAGNYSLLYSLHEHRVGIVRQEARATLLAYNYLRGLPFEACENKQPSLSNPINWESVERMVKRYGPWRTKFDPEAWMKGEVLEKAA